MNTKKYLYETTFIANAALEDHQVDAIVTRVQEFPQSIPPYESPQLQTVSGTLPYAAPTIGTFTAILRCYYLGSMVGLGYVSCPACRDGGQFTVIPPAPLEANTTTTSLSSIVLTRITTVSLTSTGLIVTNPIAPSKSSMSTSSTTQVQAGLAAFVAAVFIVTMILLRKRRAGEKRERTQVY
jgi:hypothetical protein